MAVIDATILMLFLRPNVPVPAAIDRPVDRVNFLIESLEKAKATLIIPTPVLAEVLVRASATEAQQLVEKINKYAVFRIVPFDTRAAIEVAAMTRAHLDGGGKKKDAAATFAKLKYDRQIVATAIVAQETVIYSDDRSLRTVAKRAKIEVIGLVDLPLPPADPQLRIDFEASSSANQPPEDAADEDVPLDAELGGEGSA
jgi:predicted nucleic acid-binding protein